MKLITSLLQYIGIAGVAITVLHTVWEIVRNNRIWLNNITITEKPYKDGDEYPELGDGIYPEYFEGYTEEEKPYVTATFLIPKDTILKNVKIKKVIQESIPTGQILYKTVREIPEITPDRPLCMIVARKEAIAEYTAQWTVDYGAKAIYYFYDNLRDGNNDRVKGVEYTFSWLAMIRKLLDLK